MKKFLLMLPFLSLFSCSSSDNGLPGGEEKESTPVSSIELNASQKKIVGNQNNFGIEMLGKLIETGRLTDNTVISPLSISYALGMAANGAEGETCREILKALNVGSLEEINSLNSKLIDELPRLDSDVRVSIANSMWFDNRFSVKQGFVNDGKEYYNADVSTLDLFSSECVPQINGWVNEKTNGLIKNVFNDAPCMDWALINALYFKGQWKGEFKPFKEGMPKFTNADGSIRYEVFMSRVDKLDYAGTDKFESVALPYGKGAYRMIVMLPKDDGSILTGDEFGKIRKTLSNKLVSLIMPEFQVNYITDVKDNLKDLGIRKAFMEDAEFGKMTDSQTCINAVKHITTLTVDKKGTEGSSATVLGPIVAGDEEITTDIIRIDVNRPFYFVIEESGTETILFAGKINKL